MVYHLPGEGNHYVLLCDSGRVTIMVYGVTGGG